MTKAQLIEYATEHNIPGVSSSMSKAEIIEVIQAVQANPLITLTVDALIDTEADLFGKTVTDLQEGITVGDDAITGTLKYVDDYSSAFSGDLSSGNYIVLHAEVPAADGVTITATVTDPSTLDEDGIMVLRIADKDTQTITIAASKEGYETVTKVYSLTGLTCNDS